MGFAYTYIEQDGIGIYSLSGILLDAREATQLNNEMENQLAENRLFFILNMQDLLYLNSAGIGCLISLYTKVRNQGGEMVLCNIAEPVNKLLLMTKLQAVFSIKENIEEAKKYFQTCQQD